MDNIHQFRPKLVLNRLFIDDLMAADTPCFALGLVQERDDIMGFIALRPADPIPAESTAQGFSLGHAAFGSESHPVFQFSFQFYGHGIFNGLLNPSSFNANQVLKTMAKSGDYFIFAVSPNNSLTAFRSGLEGADLAQLRENMDKFGDVWCRDDQYETTLAAFKQNPVPRGKMLNWVCRDNPDYLDIEKHPLELNPA